MANAPLTIRFASDIDSAKQGIASLSASIATNMATVAGSALAAGRTVTSAGTTIIGVFQSINRMASNFRKEDQAQRAGRQSWRRPRAVLEERPYLKAIATYDGTGRGARR